jgi:putative methionine-R-sulfoxide reductase with GAF domain
VAHEAAVSKNVAEALKNFQAKHHFISIAIYRIVGDHAVRIATEGATCGQCERVPITSSNIGMVARTGKPHVSEDVWQDPMYKSCFSGVKAETVFPVNSNGTVLAVIDLEADGATPICSSEIETFATEITALLTDSEQRSDVLSQAPSGD